MTPAIGTPSGMDPFALDAGTAERLVTGALDAGDAPPEYRAVARAVHALCASPESSEWVGEQAAVERIATAVVVHRRPSRRERRIRRSWSRAARLVAAVGVAGAVCLTGAFASAGALPQPAQHAASAVLGTVGISVPSGGEEPTGEPPPTVASTTPPVATGPSEPTAGTPGAGAVPAAPSNPTGPGNGGGTPARGTPPSNAKGHGNDHAPNGASPRGEGNGNGR